MFSKPFVLLIFLYSCATQNHLKDLNSSISDSEFKRLIEKWEKNTLENCIYSRNIYNSKKIMNYYETKKLDSVEIKTQLGKPDLLIIDSNNHFLIFKYALFSDCGKGYSVDSSRCFLNVIFSKKYIFSIACP